jgi:chloramphenicol 3-O phosphotransferase
MDSAAGVHFGQLGEVTVGEGFREAEAAWMTGIAAMARAGARIIVEDVFLGGAVTQRRMREHLEGLEVLWVGVRCQTRVAVERERARADRVIGMAVSQAEAVHDGVSYDVEVETSHTSSMECARAIATRVA